MYVCVQLCIKVFNYNNICNRVKDNSVVSGHFVFSMSIQ